jgi:hypothetical protein
MQAVSVRAAPSQNDRRDRQVASSQIAKLVVKKPVDEPCIRFFGAAWIWDGSTAQSSGGLRIPDDHMAIGLVNS